MKHETHPQTAPSPLVRKLRQYWPVLPLACILFALMLSDLDVMGYSPLRSDPCGLQEIDQSTISGKLYGPLAQRALRASSSATPAVAIVTIDANTEPPGLLTNTCDSRTFLARLVDDLNLLGARVIMIDKDYSPTSCADSAKTGNFIARLLASRASIVVGQATHAVANTSAGCLALSPRLEFTPPAASTPAVPPTPQTKVAYGLTRLNSDTLKIPFAGLSTPNPPAPSPPASSPP